VLVDGAASAFDATTPVITVMPSRNSSPDTAVAVPLLIPV